LTATGCGSASHTAAPTSLATTGSSATQPACLNQQQAGILADFGHFTSVAAANRVIDRADSAGFKGLSVEQRSCTDFAVVLRGLTSMRQARSFQREADGAGFKVTLDCRSAPLQGSLVAVFGHRRTLSAANRLAAAAAHRGFKGLQVVQDRCTDWEVVLYGLQTSLERREFAREARTAGFHVTFEQG
jgi:hypothetical protein